MCDGETLVGKSPSNQQVHCFLLLSRPPPFPSHTSRNSSGGHSSSFRHDSVPRLKQGRGVLVVEKQRAPQLGQLLLALKVDEGVLGVDGGVLDLLGLRHHQGALCMDAGQHGVLGLGEGVLALSPQEYRPRLGLLGHVVRLHLAQLFLSQKS